MKLKAPILVITFFILIVSHFSCKPDNIVGVYGGVTMSANLMNSTPDRRDVVLFLRKDGTFTDKLKDADWKTAVIGKYLVEGSTLKLVYTEKNRVEEYQINVDGNLKKNETIFIKMDKSNQVPEGTYRFRASKSSGGTGTGQHYVGTGWGSNYYFDGKDKFRVINTATTNITGNNVGGGTSSKSAGSGTYKLEDGTLTLNFSNGKSNTHSFFATKESTTGRISAVIDGRFFFSDDAKDSSTVREDSSVVREDSSRGGDKSTVKTDGVKLPPASAIYQALRSAHGGEAIDNIGTIYSEGSSIGLDIKSFIDLKNKKTRHEIYQKDKLVAVEQSDGESGWQWMKGKFSTIEPERIEEIIYSGYIGIPGLQSSKSEYFLEGVVEAASHGYNITFRVNEHQFIYIVDKSFRLLGDAYKIGQIEQANEYRNFNKIGNLLVPFTEESYRDDQKNIVTYRKYVVNEPLKTKWSKP